MRENYYDTIEHRFLVTGHTFLPSDRDFALIERYKNRNCQQIFSPGDWFEIVKKANKTKPFFQITLERSDFYCFQKLLAQNLVKKKQCDDRSPLKISQARILKFHKENINEMLIKESNSGNFVAVNLGKKGIRKTKFLTLEKLENKYKEPLKIDEKKLNDVKSLMKFIPENSQKYYLSLVSDINKQNSTETQNIKNVEHLEESEDEFDKEN